MNQQEFEAQATLDQACATRDQDQANLQAAEANLAQAQLNFGYCTNFTPITRRIGAITQSGHANQASDRHYRPV